MRVFVPDSVGSVVHKLKVYYPIITASDNHIIMLTKDDWDRVLSFIEEVDDKSTKFHVPLPFDGGLWGECFWVVWNDELEKKNEDCSFWSVCDEHLFLKVCHYIKVSPVLLPMSFSIPWHFSHNDMCIEESHYCNDPIDLLDN